MATWHGPPHGARSLSPITELTTPASLRSISLPHVDHEYDYHDESPIDFRLRQADDGDGDSVYSQESTRTIVPAEPSAAPAASLATASPPISPPANIRPFPSPTEGLPPPPRSLISSLRGSTPHNTPPASLGLAYLEGSSSIATTPIAPIGFAGVQRSFAEQENVGSEKPGQDEEPEHGDEDWDRASVVTASSAGIAGVGAGMKSTAPGPRNRPNSLQGTSQMSNRPEAPLRFATTFHSSLVNIPLVASPGFSPAQAPSSGRKTPRGGTPVSSRPSSIHEPTQPPKRPDPPIRVASLQSTLFNTPIVQSPAFSPSAIDPSSRRGTPRGGTPASSRPTSIHDATFPRHDSPVQIAAYHPSLVGIPVLPSPGYSSANRDPAPRRGSPSIGTTFPARPKSLHNTARPQRSGIPVRIASFHASLVNIPVMPSPNPTPAPASPPKLSPPSRQASTKTTPAASPTRSKPTSPKTRPSTLKKRPTSLQASRPISWHTRKPVPSPDSTIKAKKVDKAKRRSLLSEGESGPSSNDTHSDAGQNGPRPGAPVRRNSRIPSILLSLFEPNSAKLSRSTSAVNSPATSSGGHSPRSPITPGLTSVHENADESEVASVAPLAAIRTSGTFGIQDDGSVHLLLDDASPRKSTSSTPGRPTRRRDSVGTVMSATIDRVLIMGNPDPESRLSIDEDDEFQARRNSTPFEPHPRPVVNEEDEGSTDHQTRRSLTPFEPDNPASPLEIMLAANASAVAVSGSPVESQPERKSVDGPHNLLVIPGRSDTSQRAQSPSEGRTSESTSRADLATTADKAATMVDDWTQTSRPTSVVSSLTRPLPRPPTRSSDRQPGSTRPDHIDGLPSRLRDRVRPTSLPPLLSPSAYPQPGPPRGDAPLSPPPTPDLPLLIASHLLSNHATALMRHSAGMAEGAEMMKRMADESMQWGAMLLHMASGQAVGSGMPQMPSAPPGPNQGAYRSPNRPTYPGIPTSATDIMFDPLYPSRPVFHPPPPPSRDPSTPNFQATQLPKVPSSQHNQPQSRPRDHRASESDRYTPLPPRLSPRRSRSHFDAPSGFYDELDTIGRRGWDELHQAEETWVKGMDKMKALLDKEPGWDDKKHRGIRRSTGMVTLDSAGDERSSHTSHGQEQDEEYKTAESGGPLSNETAISSARELPKALQYPPARSRPSGLIGQPVDKRDTAHQVSQRQSQQSTRTSAIRTDESFLPSPSDLLPSATPTSDTRTDESFLPRSIDLITPFDSQTIRARSDARQRQPFSPDSYTYHSDRQGRPLSMSVPTSAVSPSTDFASDTGKGYDSTQIHPLLYSQRIERESLSASTHNKFDLKTTPLPPVSSQGVEGKDKVGSPSLFSTTSRRGRKLKKRSSQQLGAQTQDGQSQFGQAGTVTGGSTMRTMRSSGGGKKHWWSRRSRGTGGSEDWRAPSTAV